MWYKGLLKNDDVLQLDLGGTCLVFEKIIAHL